MPITLSTPVNLLSKKTLMLLFVLVSSTQLAQSQVLISGKDINQLDIQYCIVEVYNHSLKREVNAEINYGQRLVNARMTKIENRDGSIKRFNSLVDVLNFMYKNGWEYVEHVREGDEYARDQYFMKRMPTNAID